MIKNFIKSKPIASYISTVLILTWIITGILFVNPNMGKQYFPILMFIPAIVAYIFNKESASATVTLYKGTTRKSLLFGFLYPIVFIMICTVLVLLFKIGKLNMEYTFSIRAVITILVTIFIGLFSAWGEEAGWRGYLLPKVTDKFGKTKAAMIVGLVWGLYHMPAVFLLATATGMPTPLVVCLTQALAAFCYSFPTSYCYYISGSLLPVLFIHSVWNVINNFMLGDIYKNVQGIVIGDVFFMNGEGIIGVIVGIIMIFVFIRLFKNLEINQSKS